ncbi:hypothetical protein FACS1894137_03550 [Spirochaetia bacterium]|nr:hypothetical protein FACS1894137_03550 [Spirochaetia bacterium]
MPNWCENYLKVVGDRKDLDVFLAECFSKDEHGRVFLDFEKIVPLGDTGDDWYEKNLNNWGTKWNVSDCDIEDNDSSFTLWFETAWSPPIPIMEALTKKYTGLSFTLEYSEGGVGYRGIFESQNGEVLQNDSWDMTREDMIELGYLDEDEEEEETA